MSGETRFVPTPQDWISANRLWYRRARSRRILKWLGIAALVLALASVTLNIVSFHQAWATAVGDVLPMALFGLIVAGVPFLNLWLVPRQVRRQFSQRPSMTDETQFAWTDDMLTGTSRAGTTIQPWRELHRQLRDDRSFVFLLTDAMLLTVPRRALTDEQADDLARTADRYGPPPG